MADREIPIYQIRLQYAYEVQGYTGKTGETTYNQMTYMVRIHDNYTPGGNPLRVDIDHVARRAEVAKTGSYWDLNEAAKPTAPSLIIANAAGELSYLLPDSFAAADHDHSLLYYTKSEVDVFLGQKASINHTHDDRYHLKSEIFAFLSQYSQITHNHASLYYTKDAVDSMISSIVSSPLVPVTGGYTLDRGFIDFTDALPAKALIFQNGSDVLQLVATHGYGFDFVGGAHSFAMNTATGVFTSGDINYPAAPPAAPQILQYNSDGSTQFIASPDFSSVQAEYIPIKHATENSLVTSPLRIVSGNIVNAGKFSSWNDGGIAIEAIETTGTALYAYSASGTAAQFGTSSGTALHVTGSTVINGALVVSGNTLSGNFDFSSYTGITIINGLITAIY